MLNALCSGALQVRFMYAGYTPVIRDNPVSEYSAICCYWVDWSADHTHRFISHI
ncbi:hypothetical protein AC03_5365 [Escherichia coli 3-073-06_S3_C1]|nr:hypothetical protein AC13_5598 [Escherichia coli 2-011-08_S3_C2]KDY42131.1 hypothetical protein AB91_5525 [Escherichia coli 2-460-02_S3_C1]KDY83503.1 hypothetical protein AC21_5535 [Escherichia coli 2-474-04_S3_C2]KDZ56462.1 hypothetical protein AC03_5365 [Escherichia coli 3-073-06_S3_C1]KDZ56712.1 hypothetical protein AC31_5455 [Escherichia coli 3-073-06_S3_C2]